MNQVFAGATALIIALTLWSFGKKPRAFLRFKDTYNSASGQTQQQLSFVVETKNPKTTEDQTKYLTKKNWHPKKTIQERVILKKQLNKLISGTPEERLEAINLANDWGDSAVLPILRQGLKDFDSQVVLLAAAAIEKHRRVPKQQDDQESSVGRPPRNVALMR